jgi:hypothetical protein
LSRVYRDCTAYNATVPILLRGVAPPGSTPQLGSLTTGGFFWNDGNVVTTRPSKYASTAEVNWTNAG